MISLDSIKKAVGAPLVESKKLGCCLTDTKLRFVFINDAFTSISGYSKEEIIGKPISVILDSNLFKVAFEELTFFLKNRSNKKNTWFFYHKNGAKMHAIIETSLVKVEGKSYILTVATDVTGETKLRDELSETQQLLAQTEVISESGSFKYNPVTGESVWSDGMYYLFDLSPGDPKPSLEEQSAMLPAKDLANYQNAIDTCIKEGTNFDLVIELNLPGGNKKYIHSVVRKVKNRENWVFGSSKDITEQKLTRSKIEESEKRYRILAESLPSIIWTSNSEGYLNYMNRHGLLFFGNNTRDFENWRWKTYLHPDEKEEADRQWFYALQTKTAINTLNRFKQKDGVFKWFQVLIIPQKNEEGEIETWIGIAADIDQRIKTEEQLLLANTRLRSLIDASPVPIYSMNIDGIVQDFWNPAAEKLLGWKKEEAVGKFLPHVSEEYTSHFLELARETKEKGNITKRMTRKNKAGEDVIIEVTGGCVYDENGNISEILVTAMDLTEIENSRKKIQQSLEEKETLLQEIHHRVKNNLAIVVSLLQLQVFRSENENEKYRLTEAQNRVHSIAMVHELLYQSEDFSSVDLVTYYQKLINTISNNMQINKAHVNTDLDIGINSLNINQAIPLGLLINELATNSFKYAFNDPEKDGAISLKIRRTDNRIFVTYSDNGPGFDMSKESFKAGLGMKILDSLLTQLEAEYSIDSVHQFKIQLSFLEKGSGPIERAKK